MWKNYFKIALRNLFRQRLYSGINILGLAFGLACFLLIALYVVDEWTYDGFHNKKDQIYRVVERQPVSNGSEQYLTAISFKLGDEAVARLPEVQQSTKTVMFGRFVLRNEANQQEFYQEFTVAEPSFFEIFDFPFLQGDKSTALVEPNSIVLSKELAGKLFPHENPMGKTLTTDRGLDFTVTGVLEEIPANSHLQFDLLTSMSTHRSENWYPTYAASDWTSNNFLTYLQLDDNADAEAVAQKLTAMVERNADEEDDFRSTFSLQPLSKIHFYSNHIEGDWNEGKSNIAYITIFSIVGLFILLLACINYMNLATARSEKQGREVGIRKVSGAMRSSLINRFLAESVLVTTLAFILAYNMAYLALPFFNTFTEKELSLNLFRHTWLLPFTLGLILLVSFMAGSYPAFFLSRFRPVEVLKGSFSKLQGNFNLRQGLVVFQFVVSIVMIIGTVVAWKQMQFIQNKELGFQKDQMIIVDINSGKVRSDFELIKNGYEQVPAVKAVSVSNRVPGEWKVIPQVDMRPQDRAQERGHQAYYIGADHDFLETFGIELLDGRNFDPERQLDSTAILLNQSAADLLGITEAREQPFTIPSRFFNGVENVLETPVQVRVIGIVSDFHFQSLHEEIQPLVIGAWNNDIHSIDYFTVRTTGENTEATIAQLTAILNEVDPAHIFEYHFLDDQIASFYSADRKRSQIFTIAALCAILIACLGLFGLAAFTAEQRTKEIGIRKVLGASVSNIVQLLSKDFLKLIGIALILSIPLAWVAMRQWLENFAYSVTIQWWMFALAGIVAAGIALLTVSYQSIRAALSNPANSIKSE